MNIRMTAFPSPLKCIDYSAANIHKYTVNGYGSDILGPKRKDVRGDWRRIRNKELYDLYSSSNIIRMIKSRTQPAGHVACMGEIRCSYTVLVGRTDGKGPFGRPRSRMVDNIEVDLEEMRAWVGLNWLRMGTNGRLL